MASNSTKGTGVRTGLLRSGAASGVMAIALVAVPAAADVKQGVEAWSEGNYNAAVKEWQLPAEQGDADALFNLAQAYRLGRGVDADMARARTLYQEAAQLGHVKAADNFGLLLFQQGEQAKAMPFIKDASDRGDPRAQYVLGLAHFNADYAEKDWVRAYALLTLANGKGLPQAATALKQMDGYVPLDQRQLAQSLARSLEQEAAQRRSAELAAIDLGQPAAPAPAPASAPVLAPAAASYTPASPQPVFVEQASQRAPAPVRAAPTRATYTPAPVAPAQPAVSATSTSARDGKWRVQLGAFGVSSNADRLWSKLSSNPALSGTSKALVPGGNVTRLQAVGFYSRAEAQRACDSLKSQGQACLVKQP